MSGIRYFIVAIVSLLFANANAYIAPSGRCDDRTYKGPNVTLQQVHLADRRTMELCS